MNPKAPQVEEGSQLALGDQAMCPERQFLRLFRLARRPARGVFDKLACASMPIQSRHKKSRRGETGAWSSGSRKAWPLMSIAWTTADETANEHAQFSAPGDIALRKFLGLFGLSLMQ